MLAPSDIRTNRPEFASTTAFPDAAIQRLLDRAYRLMDPNRWRDILDDGVEAWVAHFLTIARRNVIAAATGDGSGVGETTGMVNSESVDKVSVGYDTGSIALLDAGPYNSTTYGQEFWQLASIISIGGFQL